MQDTKIINKIIYEASLTIVDQGIFEFTIKKKFYLNIKLNPTVNTPFSIIF